MNIILEDAAGDDDDKGEKKSGIVKLFQRYELIKNNEQFQQYTKEGITLESEPSEQEAAKLLTQPHMDQLA